MLKRIILSPIDLLLLFWGWVIYMVTGSTTKRTYNSMVRLFCITKGYSSEIIHSMVTLFRRPYLLKHDLNGAMGSFNQQDIRKITGQLNTDGYYIFENRLQSETVDRLVKFAQETDAFARPYRSDGSAVVERTKMRFDSEHPETIRYDWHATQLLQNEDVQKLISDEVLLAISQEYLGCAPIVDGVRMWWNTTFSKDPNPEAATMYHFDMERLKWFKVFVYLTDVSEENGPHAFIKGTHKVGALPYDLLKKGYVMSSDEEIYNYFDKNEEILYTAPRGTMIIEDTKGLHKGTPVKSGDRLILQMQFSDCMFGMDSDASFPTNKTKELTDAINKYPKVYEYYNRD